MLDNLETSESGCCGNAIANGATIWDSAKPEGWRRLAIEAVVVAWLRYLEIEQQLLGSGEPAGARPPGLGPLGPAAGGGAEALPARAMEMLARLRRLELPAVQVNIGAQQVNQVKMG